MERSLTTIYASNGGVAAARPVAVVPSSNGVSWLVGQRFTELHPVMTDTKHRGRWPEEVASQ